MGSPVIGTAVRESKSALACHQMSADRCRSRLASLQVGRTLERAAVILSDDYSTRAVTLLRNRDLAAMSPEDDEDS
jgi:hypothetical protein